MNWKALSLAILTSLGVTDALTGVARANEAATTEALPAGRR
ncbi:hypothetical protein P12x_006163 (plasmid) [Tundrisphaera lichenicola]